MTLAARQAFATRVPIGALVDRAGPRASLVVVAAASAPPLRVALAAPAFRSFEPATGLQAGHA